MFEYRQRPITKEYDNYDNISWNKTTYCLWIDKGNTELDKIVARDNYVSGNIICRECQGCQ